MEVKFSVSALKSFKRLDKPLQNKIVVQLQDCADGVITDVKKMQGYKNLYRIRINDYRIVFQLLILEDTIYVVRVGHRREVYRNLPPGIE